jgi:recombination protein RecR
LAFSPLVNQLIHALRVLPGVGNKTAQRMAFYLLERNRDGGQQLADILKEAVLRVGRCKRCRVLCETAACSLCVDHNRDKTQLCIVESPANVAAIEHAGGYKGLYFVLSGHLSPIDGIGPEDIGISDLVFLLEDEPIQEVVLATSSTVEGEATAYYIAELVKNNGILVTRIAQGVPMGGELDFVDGGTISRALKDRCEI